jgi:hypothetical protein
VTKISAQINADLEEVESYLTVARAAVALADTMPDADPVRSKKIHDRIDQLQAWADRLRAKQNQGSKP